jgi:hypothetical protein
MPPVAKQPGRGGCVRTDIRLEGPHRDRIREAQDKRSKVSSPAPNASFLFEEIQSVIRVYFFDGRGEPKLKHCVP